MKFFLYSPVSFEPWDWRSSVETGIGGSETSHVEMAWRLARRGHEVVTYAPIPADCPGEWRGTKWFPLDKADFTQDGLWVFYRCPEMMDEFPKTPGQSAWLICQDFDYDSWTPERVAKIDRIVPLCKSHEQHIANRHRDIPGFAEKMWITSNGVKVDLIEEIEKEIEDREDPFHPTNRNPLRIMHASSPDRGLLPLLKSFKKAREYVPDLELHAFYGFNNIDKLIERGEKSMARMKAEILKWADQKNVYLHGRISQPDLYREWFKSGIYCYETNFWETSHISGQEAQCMGAIPVFSPVWGQAENISHGIAVAGDANDPLTQARFAAELVRLALDPHLQASIRFPMMRESRKRFDWENWVTQWEHASRQEMPAEVFV